MEPEKRKRPDDDGDVDDGKKAKKEDISGGDQSAVSEEEVEVEEFFAILRRIHVAVKYFEKANNGGGRKLAMNNEWKPSFLLQDFEGGDEVKNEEKPEDLEEDSGFDLNLEPVSEEKRID